MNRVTKLVVTRSLFVLGVVLTPAMAQHDSHGDHPFAKKGSSPSFPSCPVTGEPINFATSVATDGGPVFFCCKRCVAKYQANPLKYVAEVAAQRNALANRPKVQVICPVTKESVDQDVFVESNGEKIYFCCKDCVKKYQKTPAQYASALANSYTYQTKCPVMGEEIDPTAFTTTANGMNIYFCCNGCDKKFLKDPQKYTPNLVAQGFTVDPKELVQNPDEKAGHESGSHDEDGHDDDHHHHDDDHDDHGR